LRKWKAAWKRYFSFISYGGVPNVKNIAVRIEDLDYYYPGNVAALKNINLTIYQNEIVGLIGQNGAGKTTLLKTLLGLLKPSKGRVIIDGIDTRKLTVAQLATREGFVLQNPDRQLFADTVEKEIVFGPQNLRLPENEIKNRVEEAMKAVSIEKFRNEYPLSLSKGDRAKVVIASVLAMKPHIIILDEPTTGQDYLGCLQVMQIVKKLHKLGHTVIIVTHHMPLVAEYTARTIVLCKGELLLDGPTEEIFAQPEVLAKTYITPPQITQLAQRLGTKMGISSKALSVEELGEEILAALNRKQQRAAAP
jgi:energy-coupling factor transport system ATP-binding protein